jgi:hypothetical protein
MKGATVKLNLLVGLCFAVVFLACNANRKVGTNPYLTAKEKPSERLQTQNKQIEKRQGKVSKSQVRKNRRKNRGVRKGSGRILGNFKK